MSIYTKKGDKGNTSTIDGQRVSKGGLQIELQGSIDEINAMTGYLRSLIIRISDDRVAQLDQDLRDVQHTLFMMGPDISSGFEQKHVTDGHIKDLETGIDTMMENTGPFRGFIYYSGSEASTYCHTLRSVTRRGERAFVRYLDGMEIEWPEDYRYINRLADYFYAIARYLNHIEGVDDELIHL